MVKRMAQDTITQIELRELAKAMGCRTQKDLAFELGVTQARISQILSGTYPVKPGPLLLLIRELEARYVRGRKIRKDDFRGH